MTRTPRSRLEALSVFIYGAEAGVGFLKGLLELADRERAGPEPAGLHTAAVAHDLSERDCVLIAYGDSVLPGRGTGKAARLPLQVLRDFIARRGAGLFSHVHLLPFFPYSSDDGFSVLDYRTVDPALGDWEDIRALAREFGLVCDVVLNHNSAKSAWFKAFLAGELPYKTWYLTRPSNYDASAVVRPRTLPLLTEFTAIDGRRRNVWTTFSADQVDFDFGNPAVLLEFLSIIAFYVRNGAALLRLDAIAYLWKEDGNSCIHHPKTHAVVKLIRSFLEYLEADVKLLTETNVPHAENVSYFGEGDEAHLVYNFALPPLILHAAVSGDAGPLLRWAGALKALPEGCCFYNFLASHDGIGLTPAAGLVDEEALATTIRRVVEKGGKVSYKAGPGGPIPYELNTTYLSAVSRPDAPPETNARIFLTAHAAMLAFAGVPALYFHSWVGSTNWLEGVEKLGHNRAINREKLPVDSLEAELAAVGSLRRLVSAGLERLLRFRAARSVFSPVVAQTVIATEGSVFGLVRGPDATGHYAICASNFCGEERVLDFAVGSGSGQLKLRPYGTHWCEYEDGRMIAELDL